MKANPQKAMVSALESVLAYDSTAAAAGCKMPILYVSSGPWYTDVSRFRELCPQLVTGQTVGGGHYFPLEIPEQVNPMVERFLKISQTLSVAPWPWILRNYATAGQHGRAGAAASANEGGATSSTAGVTHDSGE